MIPPFDDSGNLPSGIHWATWDELVARYGTNEHRQMLIRGLRKVLAALKAANCHTVYINGSFVSTKDKPRDYDACWEIEGIEPNLLDPVLLELDNRLIQKAKFRGELFPVDSTDKEAEWSFLEYFQTDKDTKLPKGIIAIDLRGWSDD